MCTTGKWAAFTQKKKERKTKSLSAIKIKNVQIERRHKVWGTNEKEDVTFKG